MAKPFLSLSLPDPVSLDELKKALDRLMEKALRHAIRTALQVHFNQIHFLSGMARGTFMHVSRLVGAGLSFPTKSGWHYYRARGAKREVKTAQLGASVSTAPSALAAQKRFHKEFPIYYFEMQTALRYFNIEDEVRWNFTEPFVETAKRELGKFIEEFGPGIVARLFGGVIR